MNGVYGAVTDNYKQFWFLQFRGGIFGFKDTPCTGRSVVENGDKITEMIDVSIRSNVQELKIDQVLNHLGKAGFKKKLDC